LLKLILETSQLNRSQIIAGCAMAAAAQFDFVKTSTGFNGQGATVENVRLMAACCERLAEGNGGRRRMKVKAAGGIRTLEDAVKMLEAGASRLGTSGGVWIAKEAKAKAERGVNGKGILNGTANDERPGMQTRLFTDY
jgi:deoxyribose-phosphate aldolase